MPRTKAQIVTDAILACRYDAIPKVARLLNQTSPGLALSLRTELERAATMGPAVLTETEPAPTALMGTTPVHPVAD